MIVYRLYFRSVMTKFLFFILALFVIFSLIDSTFHPHWYAGSILEGITFAFLQFSKKAALFVPFCFLLSLLFTLVRSNQNKEIIALFTSGYTQSTLSIPFYRSAAVICSLLVINQMWLAPWSYQTHSSKELQVHHIQLNGYDMTFTTPLSSETLDNVYLKKDNDLYHIKKLTLSSNGAKGEFVDHFSLGTYLEKKQLAFNTTFPKINIPYLPKAALSPLKDLSPYHLFEVILIPGLQGELRTGAFAHLLFHLCVILSPFVIVMVTLPPTCTLRRSSPLLRFLMIGSICYLMGFLMLEALVILMTGGIVPIWSPAAVGVCVFVWKQNLRWYPPYLRPQRIHTRIRP